VSELALGEEVNLDFVDDDSRVVDWGGTLKLQNSLPSLLVMVMVSPSWRDETAFDAGSFDEDGETFGGGLVGRVHV
jgi:hypothetical protein